MPSLLEMHSSKTKDAVNVLSPPFPVHILSLEKPKILHNQICQTFRLFFVHFAARQAAPPAKGKTATIINIFASRAFNRLQAESIFKFRNGTFAFFNFIINNINNNCNTFQHFL